MAASLRGVRPAFRAAAEAFVPEAAQLDARGWEEVEAIIVDALARRPAALRRQLMLFVRLLDVAALARHGRRLRRLDLARRTRLLERLQDAPLLLLRRGTWGLRTLVFMGYYARPAADTEIGYRAQLRGWSMRRGPGASPATGAAQ